MLPCVTTDLTNTQIINLAFTVTSLDVAELKTYRIPVDGGYKAAVINKMQVLVPDLEINRQALQQNLFEH
jgi:hypothetical protein